MKKCRWLLCFSKAKKTFSPIQFVFYLKITALKRKRFRRIRYGGNITARKTLYSIAMYVARMVVASFISFVKHNKVFAHHFRGEFFVTFFVFPTAGFEASFDINQAALVKIFL